MSRFIYLIYLTALLFACNSESEKSGTFPIKEIEIDLSQPITYKASQFFDTCFIVPLSNEELIGQVSDLYFDENQIIVNDRKISQKIYRYNWGGDLLGFIGTEGEGPGEYKFQRHVQLLSPDELVIYSNATNKLVYQVINEKIGRDLYLDTLGPLSDLQWINNQYYLTRENRSNQSNQIVILNKEFNQLDVINLDEEFLSQDKSKYGMGKDHLIFPKWGENGFYFSDVENPYILDFEKDRLKTIYRIRFSEREIDYSVISTGSERGKLNMAKEHNLAYFANSVQVHPHFLFLGYGDGIFSKMAIWDKKSTKAYPVEEIENDISLFPNLNSIGISLDLNAQPGYHIFIIEAAMLVDILDKIESEENPYLEKLRRLKIKKDDNPVLFFFRFKEKVELEWP